MAEISRKQLREMQRSRSEVGTKRKKGLMTLAFVAAILVGVVSLFLFLAQLTKKSADEEKSLGVESFAIVGEAHIKETDPRPEYNSNPPTSGNHLSTPAAWATYQNELDDRQVVHNLEHGGIWVTYNCKAIKKSAFGGFIETALAQMTPGAGGVTKPGIETGSITTDPDCLKMKSDLEEWAKSHTKKLVLNPRVANDRAISIAAWGKLMHLDSFDGEKLDKFYKLFKDKGPEFFPD